MPRITGEILHSRARSPAHPARSLALERSACKGMRIQTDRQQHGQPTLSASGLATLLGSHPSVGNRPAWPTGIVIWCLCKHRNRHKPQAPTQSPPSRVTASAVNPSERPSAVMVENSFEKSGPCAQTLALGTLDRRTVHHGDRKPRRHRSTHAATPLKRQPPRPADASGRGYELRPSGQATNMARPAAQAVCKPLTSSLLSQVQRPWPTAPNRLSSRVAMNPTTNHNSGRFNGVQQPQSNHHQRHQQAAEGTGSRALQAHRTVCPRRHRSQTGDQQRGSPPPLRSRCRRCPPAWRQNWRQNQSEAPGLDRRASQSREPTPVR